MRYNNYPDSKKLFSKLVQKYQWNKKIVDVKYILFDIARLVCWANDSLDNIDANADDLPVLQVPVKIEEVSNPSLVQAQETCVLLHQMILSNQDLATNELVLSVVQQLRVSQNDIMAILNTTNNEADMAQALAVNDLIVQLLFGYEEVAAGRMRREGPYKEGEESERATEDAPLFPDLGDAVVTIRNFFPRQNTSKNIFLLGKN